MLIRPCQALSFSFFNFNYIWKKREKRKGEKKFCDVKGGQDMLQKYSYMKNFVFMPKRD